jgi:hypothetical protein
MKNNSNVDNLVYDFIDEVSHFNSNQYEVCLTKTISARYIVTAESKEQAEEIATSCAECNDIAESESIDDVSIESIDKVNIDARSAINEDVLDNFIKNFSSILLNPNKSLINQ